MDAVEKDDLDLDAGRHLDDGLVLFGAFDEISADGVGGFAGTLAEATGEDVGRRQRLDDLALGDLPRLLGALSSDES